ncbi:Fructosamine/Ketosamine-3-kinase [Penicillium lividum]|nr:Fructosamine/Ketosamine-3-kinase [Penicillium lividum]
MTDPSIWDEEVTVPKDVVSFVDNNVSKYFPDGVLAASISQYGASYWTRTAEIKLTDFTGSEGSYFLKVAQGEIGKGMMYGEFHSMTAIYNAMPGKTSAEQQRVRYVGRMFLERHRAFFQAEEDAQGFDEEMAALRKDIMEKVIPRLLRPLETGGNKIVPSLAHGDIWDGNTSVDAETGNPLIFDACSSYTHHEYDLAPWRPVRHKIGKPYVEEYLKYFPASEPTEDFDDRNALYCV